MFVFYDDGLREEVAWRFPCLKAFQDCYEVGSWIKTVGFDVFDQSVEHGMVCSAFGVAYEQPVFYSKFCGANRVFYSVIIDVDPTVFEVADEFIPLA